MSVASPVQTHGRIAPRFDVKLAAELAAGSALVPVTICNLSSTGCGIQILTRDLALADKIGSAGLLHLQAINRCAPAAILPVVLRNMRFEGNILRYGLEFRNLMPHQARKLAAILETVIPDESERSHWVPTMVSVSDHRVSA